MLCLMQSVVTMFAKRMTSGFTSEEEVEQAHPPVRVPVALRCFWLLVDLVLLDPCCLSTGGGGGGRAHPPVSLSLSHAGSRVAACLASGDLAG